MESIYRSKVDAWLICLLICLFVLIIAPMVLLSFSLTVVFITAVISFGLLGFIFYYLFNIKYIIKNNTLNIKDFLTNDKVDISQITKIEPSQSLLSAPAASLDRISIYVIKKRSPIVVSPKDKKGFIEELKSINKNIQTDLVE